MRLQSNKTRFQLEKSTSKRCRTSPALFSTSSFDEMDSVRRHDRQAVLVAGDRVGFGHFEAVVHVDDGLKQKPIFYLKYVFGGTVNVFCAHLKMCRKYR